MIFRWKKWAKHNPILGFSFQNIQCNSEEWQLFDALCGFSLMAWNTRENSLEARQKLQWCWAAGTPTHHRWDLRHFDFMDLSQQYLGQLGV